MELVESVLTATKYIVDMLVGFAIARRLGIRVPSQLFTATVVPLILIVAMLAAPAFTREALGVILTSFVYAILPMASSALAALALTRGRLTGETARPSHGFAASVIVALLAGFALGAAGLPAPTWLIDPLLLLLVFLAGLELGSHRELRFDLGLATLPLASLAGSLAASLALYPLTGVTPAVAAGMGWYTFTGPYLYTASGDPRLAAIGFLANLIREQIAIIIVPLAAHRIPLAAAVALGGVTTMDTTLPIYVATYGPRGALAAATHGAILTLLVPILVPLVYTLLH
ncbi:lysine exporter LysO family protein [Pyrolobus fumarii]|nr:lysine exporter LysO family protein [Pyrolobus fumarii]